MTAVAGYDDRDAGGTHNSSVPVAGSTAVRGEHT